MKKRIKSFLLFIFLLLSYTNFLIGQNIRFIDTVYNFKPGKGQNTGQSAEFYPMNIFGPPSKNATESTPESSPTELLSLGFGGEIIVGFKNAYIVDKVGVDFIIFENAFLNPINKRIFAEPAVVSVSEDGINFIDFPFDSLTLEGCAGTQPTNGKVSPWDYPNCGGNGFDIATLGLTKVKYIKIRDITEMIYQNNSHPFYDATLSGFDLDAVVGLNLVDEYNSLTDKTGNYPKYFNAYVYDYAGREIISFENITESELFQKIPRGCYFLKLTYNLTANLKKICIN